MELEIQNYKIINVKLNKRKMRNPKSFNFSSSKPFKVYLEVKQEILSGKTGEVIIRSYGPSEIMQMLNSGRVTFSKRSYFNTDTHSTIEKLIDHYEIIKYGKLVKHMDSLELLEKNLVDI